MHYGDVSSPTQPSLAENKNPDWRKIGFGLARPLPAGFWSANHDF